MSNEHNVSTHLIHFRVGKNVHFVFEKNILSSSGLEWVSRLGHVSHH